MDKKYWKEEKAGKFFPAEEDGQGGWPDGWSAAKRKIFTAKVAKDAKGENSEIENQKRKNLYRSVRFNAPYMAP